MSNRHRSPFNRRRIYSYGVAVFMAGVFLGVASGTYPATRLPGIVAACVGAVLVLATLRPADRGKS